MNKRLNRITLSIPMLLAALTLFIHLSAANAQTKPAQENIKIIAHRGASGLAPENTLASFKKALEIGANILELDVHLSNDDSLIVMHDHKVNRTTDGEGEIENLDYAYISRLDAGSWFNPEYNTERVPTLGQVLRMVNGRTKVLIELKWPASGIYENLVKRVLQTIHACNAESWVMIQSFETKYLNEVRQTAPEINCQQLILGKPNGFPIYITRTLGWGKFSPVPGVTSVNVSYMYLNAPFVQRMHRQGLSVYVYTLNDKEKMLDAIDKGVDGIITNRPDLALELIKEKTF